MFLTFTFNNIFINGKTNITPNKFIKRCATDKTLESLDELIDAIKPVNVVPILAPKTIQIPDNNEIKLFCAQTCANPIVTEDD